LALPSLLYSCVPWAIRDEAKPRITSAEMKCMRRIGKYTWKDYRANEDILSELKISPVVEKIQNYRTKWIQHVGRTDRNRLLYLIFKYQLYGKRNQKTFQLVIGMEQVTTPKTLQAM
jgi:hypothetical protein